MPSPSVPVSGRLSPELRAFAAMLREDPRSLNPEGRRVDWDDGPWPIKVYDGAVRVPLSEADDELLVRLGRLLSLTLAVSTARFDPAGGLPATPTDPHPARHGPRFVTRRPIASGGSMYPTEGYVVLTRRDEAYHYDPWRHELTDLRHPAPNAAVCRALGLTAPCDLPEVILVLTSRFWKNRYKYGEFGYRLGAVDAGVVLGRSLATGAAQFGRVDVRADFDDEAINGCLGLDPMQESAYAIVGLGPAGPIAPIGDRSRPRPPSLLERSRQIPRSPRFDEMHQAVLQAAQTPSGPPFGAGAPLDDAAGSPANQAAMIARTSNGKLFTGGKTDTRAPKAVLDQTAAILAELRKASHGQLADGVEVYCAVHRVEGMSPGWYRGLSLIEEDADCARAMQSALFAGSANVELSAFTVHIVGPVDYASARDFREVQMAAGAAVDATTLAATIAGLGSHPFLGFDAPRIDAAYRLPHGRGALAQVCVGCVRPAPLVEIAVRLA